MNNSRIEKKIVLGKFRTNDCIRFLIENKFQKHYPNRNISSIYLDTTKLDFVKDNINGVSKRKKLRFRWYDNDIRNIYFEKKEKRGFLVSKKSFKLDEENEKNVLLRLKKYMNNNYYFNDKNYHFILKTNYERSYWISFNNQIRATIDTNINSNNIKNDYNKIVLPETILELKFSLENENFFRNWFAKKANNFRIQKYSKYVRSFLALEEAGKLII